MVDRRWVELGLGTYECSNVGGFEWVIKNGSTTTSGTDTQKADIMFAWRSSPDDAVGC